MIRPRLARVLPLAASAIGLAAVIVAVAGLARDTPTSGNFGDPTVAGTSAPTVVTTTNPAQPEVSMPGPAGPETLIIPTLHVRAAVEPVDTHDGELDLPDNPAAVGWWTGSAPPGSSTGTTVIAGHVDSAKTGPGALNRLTTLRPGDAVTLINDDHQQVPYTVTARRTYPKTSGLPADLFTQTGPSRLILITCGGPFDKTTRSYQNNIVVFAIPTAQ